MPETKQSGPWEKFQQPTKPWERYKSADITETATEPLFAKVPTPTYTSILEAKESAIRRGKELLGFNPDVDYSTGIKDSYFRYQLGRADTPEEKATFLDNTVGVDGWGQDKNGNYFLTPEGITRKGLPPSNVPIAIDELGINFRDIADVGEDIPGIVGGIAAGIATKGLGFIPAISAVGAAAGLGKIGAETIESVQGRQQQTPTEILDDAAGAALENVIGETGTRVLSHIGGRIIAPHTKREVKLFGERGKRKSTVDPNRLEAVDQALGIGGIPHAREASGDTLVGRIQSAAEYIAGNARNEKNVEAILKERTRILNELPPVTMYEAGEAARNAIADRVAVLNVQAKYAERQADAALRAAEHNLRTKYDKVSATDAGEAVKTSLRNARKSFSIAASNRYKGFDALVGDQPIFNIKPIKETARKWLDNMPKISRIEDYDTGVVDVAGNPIIDQRIVKETVKSLSPDGVNRLQAIIDADDMQTAQQVHTISTLMRELSEDSTAAPGVPKGIARDLFEAAQDVLTKDHNMPENLKVKWNALSSWYRAGIQKFDNATVSRILRDAKYGGSINPEDVVDFIAKRNSITELRTIKKLVPQDTWNKVKSVHRRKMFDDAIDISGEVNSSQFYNKIKGFGSTLDVMYGASEAAQIRKYAKALAMKNGKMPVSGKGALYDDLKKAVDATDARDKYLSNNFTKAITSDKFEPEKLVDFLMQPKNTNYVNQAKDMLGENSVEWQKLKRAVISNLLKTQIGHSNDGVEKIIVGDALTNALDQYSETNLKALLGVDHYNDLRKLARITHILVPRKQTFSGAIVAATIAMHPVAHIPQIVGYNILSRLFATPQWVQYVTRGFNEPKYFENATRISMQTAAQVTGMDEY